MRLVLALTSVAAATAFVSSSAAAADRIVYYGPAPAWLKPAEMPPAPDAEPGAATSIVLYDEQNRYDGEFGETTIRRAAKVVSEEGLDELGSLSEEWDPETEKVTINRVAVIRDGKVIDVLKGERFEVLRRETNLESAMLNGRLTATLQLKDLRVGDIVDFQVTRKARDPLGGKLFDSVTSLHPTGKLGRARVRLLWPKGAPMRWRVTDGFPKPVVADVGGETELVAEAVNMEGPKLPVGAPLRYALSGMIEWSQQADWDAISSSLSGLYDAAATLKPGSPLKAEIEKIRAASPDPEIRAALALKLVESQVRYVFIGMGAGAYAPAAADDTWSRRFGDCKGKTALLLALLRGLDIPAEAALVNASGWGDGLDQRLPSLARFDHVIVRTTIGGKVYWLDGTRLGDEALANLTVPDYRWALPIRARDGRLERLVQAPLVLAQDATVMRIDASAGLDAPAQVTIESVLRGDQAIASARTFSAANKDDLLRGLRRGGSKLLAWADFEQAEWAYDAAHAELRFKVTGSGKINWIDDPRSGRLWVLPSSELFAQGYDRDSVQDQTAPYVVTYPHYDRIVVYATLPRDQTYRLSGMYVNEALGGFQLTRAATLVENRVGMRRSRRALSREISAEDAKASQAKARQEYQAFGGYVIEVAKANDVDVNPSATGYKALIEGRYDAADAAFRAVLKTKGNERGAYNGLIRTALARQDYAKALKLCDAAEAQAPDAATTWMQLRVETLQWMKKDAEAEKIAAAAAAKSPRDVEVLMTLQRVQAGRDEMDAAMATAKLAEAADPKSADPLVAQARLLGRRKDWAGALERFRMAQALDPDDVSTLAAVASLQVRLKQSDEAGILVEEIRRIDPMSAGAVLAQTEVLEQMGRTDEALAVFDEALAVTPKDVGLLNGRCWLRATHNRELGKALADCNEALAQRPRLAAALDSRALVNARSGRLDAALRDYDGALKLAPKLGASLYGRGLVKLRMGDAVGGQADLAAARKLDDEIEVRFAEWGLKPS